MAAPTMLDKMQVSETWRAIGHHCDSRDELAANRFRAVLGEYLSFLGGEPFTQRGEQLLKSATYSDAQEYVSFQFTLPGMVDRDGNAARRADSTIAQNCVILSGIYNRLVALKLAETNPFTFVKKPPRYAAQKLPTEIVPFERVFDLVHAPKMLKHRAIIATLVGSGIRVGELTALKFGDLRASPAGKIYLRIEKGKNGRERQAALPQWALNILLDWAKERRVQMLRAGNKADDASYLFAARGRNSRPDRSAIWLAVRKAAQKIGLKDITPHSLRATSITKLLADGHDYKHVQNFSGHSSIQMVDWYDKRYLSVDESPGFELTF